MSLTELALLDGRRPLPLGDVIGLIKKMTKEFGKERPKYVSVLLGT
jgi:hypothetical protein